MWRHFWYADQCLCRSWQNSSCQGSLQPADLVGLARITMNAFYWKGGLSDRAASGNGQMWTSETGLFTRAGVDIGCNSQRKLGGNKLSELTLSLGSNMR